MKTSTIVWVVIVIVIVAGGWYWFSTMGQQAVVIPSNSAGLNGSADQTNTGQPAVAAVVTVATDATLGQHLVAANGMTLYMYTKDTSDVSNCSGACATNWPPYAPVTGEPLVPGDGVTGQLATITRADGTSQVTYNGKPLYFWKSDAKVGDTTGQNVGGVWFVVKP